MERALLRAFRECLIQEVTRMTVMVKRVSRTKEADGFSLGNVSTGKVVLRQRGRGHRKSD